MSEGRSCPLAYRYSAEDLCQEPRTVSEDVLYIIGGLYGNPYALDAIEAMAAAEQRHGNRVQLVFNGDFNFLPGKINRLDAIFLFQDVFSNFQKAWVLRKDHHFSPRLLALNLLHAPHHPV